jgi:hypothetical protein
MGISAIGAYSSLVNAYSTVTVSYVWLDQTYYKTYDVNVNKGYSWSLMLIATLLAIGECLSGIIALINARKESVWATAHAEPLNG